MASALQSSLPAYLKVERQQAEYAKSHPNFSLLMYTKPHGSPHLSHFARRLIVASKHPLSGDIYASRNLEINAPVSMFRAARNLFHFLFVLPGTSAASIPTEKPCPCFNYLTIRY